MTTLSAEQIADFARAAGFSGNALVTAVAVAIAESGGRTDAKGDVSLQTATWGPSIGLWQIRSLNAEKGRGSARDELANYDPGHNARSAYSIAGGGTNFKPWSTYNGGQYKAHLAAAQTAAGQVGNRSGSPGSVTSFAGDVSFPVRSDSELSVEPLVPRDISTLLIRGQPVLTSTGDMATRASVDFSTDGISEISVTFADPELAIWESTQISYPTEVDWEDWKLEIAGVSTPGWQNGIWYTTLHIWPRGLVNLQKLKGRQRSGVSPAEWIAAEAALQGISVISYEAPNQNRGSQSIGPDDSDIFGSGSTDTPKDVESAWNTMQRLAKEDGCWLFSYFDRTLIYGKPTLMVSAMSYLDVGFRGSVKNDPAFDFNNIEANAMLERGTKSTSPSLSRMPSENLVIQRTGTVSLPRWRGERVRPGMGLRLPRFARMDLGEVEPYIVTNVSWDAADNGLGDVSVRFERAVDPAGTPQVSLGEPIPADIGDATGSDGISKGTKSANDFVAWALRQVGDKYVWGATPNASDPNPTSFDCSALVQWAAAQTGVSIGRTTYAQYPSCIPITAEKAAQTRGALLFFDDLTHVVISLGNGHATVEARGAKYGVVTYRIEGRGFTKGGLIKGMNYGNGGSEQSSVFDFNRGNGPFGGLPYSVQNGIAIPDF